MSWSTNDMISGPREEVHHLRYDVLTLLLWLCTTHCTLWLLSSVGLDYPNVSSRPTTNSHHTWLVGPVGYLNYHAVPIIDVFVTGKTLVTIPCIVPSFGIGDSDLFTDLVLAKDHEGYNNSISEKNHGVPWRKNEVDFLYTVYPHSIYYYYKSTSAITPDNTKSKVSLFQSK